MSFQKLKSFTLIEFLVVIAIISILIALILPALVATKRQSERQRYQQTVQRSIKVGDTVVISGINDMKQLVVTDTNPTNFEKRVNELIEQGWRAIPLSLHTSVASTTYESSFGDRINISYICSVVLERPTL